MASPPAPFPPTSDSLEWITAYLTIHSLSVPSRRYSFILWIAVVVIFLAFAVRHWAGFGGGVIDARWSKWAIRRRTWRKQHALAVAQRSNRPHRQPVSLPSNAQLLSLTVLTLASLALAFVGPDYLAPSLRVWQMPPRAVSPSPMYNTTAYIPYMSQETLYKTFWSSSARSGQIAFSLLPLCVLFALKAPPFALFAIPFMIQLYFDKLAWLHRWAGRLIWFFTLIHVALWSVQLAMDVNTSTGRVAYVYAWSYGPFIYGWIAFVLLTLIILLSLHPIRRRFYEYFYILHIILVPCMLVTAALHHLSVAWWCWAALSLWIGERLWRSTWWVYANGIVGGLARKRKPAPSNVKDLPSDTWEMGHVRRLSVEDALLTTPVDGRPPSPPHAYYSHADQKLFKSSITLPPVPYIPPYGYLHAELLPGRTVRLCIVTPGFLPWSPGQHFLLNIPSVSWLTSHPFTCASVCDEAAPTDAGRVMIFLVRTKGGWTQKLWNLVSRMTMERSKGEVSPATLPDRLPKNGVLLRAYVDGPFGSSRRARWGNFSTGIIIVGGSGVSFGLSLLQYMSMCLAGRDGRTLGGRPGGWGWKGAELKRVRFIWLVREYSHVQWCATIIRHCMSIAPPSTLQVDICVTNFTPIPLVHPPVPPSRSSSDGEPPKADEGLKPPRPVFRRRHSLRSRSRSADSADSYDESHHSDVDLSYYIDESDDEPPPDELRATHEKNMLGLTSFDGDVEITLPGEVHLNRRLEKEGRHRRLNSRKFSNKSKTKEDVASSNRGFDDELQVPRHAQRPRRDQYGAPSRSRVRQQRNALSTYSTDGLLASSPLSGRPSSTLSEKDPFSDPSDSPLSPESASHVGAHDIPGPFVSPDKSREDIILESAKSQVEEKLLSTARTPGRESDASRISSMALGATDPECPFEMDAREAIDMGVVSEHARPGKPKLDKVIADEVQASKGSIIVACCGPASLNAMVRKAVAAQIDPGRIQRGDKRGYISIVSEEFEY